MRIMTLYVLAELLKVFVAGLVGFTAMIVMVAVVLEATKQGLPLGPTARLIPYILPEALRVAIPVTLLLATTSVYSRMSGFNEVVALKAMGISPTAILWPTFVFAAIMSFVTVWLNDVAVSWGRIGVQRVIMGAVEEIVYGTLNTERRYSCDSFSIIVKGVEDQLLLRPTVWVAERGDTSAITIEAQDAEIRADHEENVLKIILRQCRVEAGDYRVDFPEVWAQEIPLRDASKSDDASGKPSWLPLSRIDSEVESTEQAIETYRSDIATIAAWQMLSGDMDTLTGATWNRYHGTLAGMQKHLHKLRTEPYRRWSAGFSCLCFVWIGAPMAIWLRKCDFLQSFFVCFAPILIVYYPLLMFGIDRAKDGALHPSCVWAGNLILLLWGAWMLRRVLRY